MIKCKACNDKGFIFTTNEAFEDDIQKCDECNIFENDKDAQSEYINWMMEEHNLNLQWEGSND